MSSFLFFYDLTHREFTMFVKGEIYRRSHLHALYGGQEQSGISTPSKHPFIMLFTGDSGEKYGYKDAWQTDGTFLYTGQGQVDDMTFIRGNRSIRDHDVNKKALFLFEFSDTGHVRFISEMKYKTHKVIQGPDIAGKLRDVIVFVLDIV